MKAYKKILTYLLLFALFLSLSSPLTANATEKSKYHIKVNRKTNSLTVYELKKGKYKPIKAMLCSTGGSRTPLGSFSTSQKMRWHTLFGNVYGQYVTRITGHYLFHSLPYTKKSPDSLLPNTFNKLGTPASAGCVRLSVTDARWIHTHCSLGTKVTIYESNNPGPLGKPDALPYEDNGYDPTDIWAKGNPILIGEPKIEADGALVILPEDLEVDFLKGVKAYSSLGEDITEAINVEEEVDYGTPGEYQVIYHVEDDLKKKASLERTVIVK